MNHPAVALLVRIGDVWHYRCPVHVERALTGATRTMGYCSECESTYLYRPAEIPTEKENR